MKLGQTIILILFLAGVVCVSGCTSTGSTHISDQVTTAPTALSNTITPTLQPGWENLAVPEDNFNINVPTNWSVTKNDAPSGSVYFLKNVNVKNVKITPMQKIVYIVSPDSNVNVIITGVEVHNLDGSGSINSTILPQFLNACIPAVEQALKAGAPSKEIEGSQYNNIINGASFKAIVDPNLHRENGYNVMRAGINVANSNGDYIEYIEIFAVQSNDKIYFEQLSFINNAASDPTVQSIMSTMLGSLTPT